MCVSSSPKDVFSAMTSSLKPKNVVNNLNPVKRAKDLHPKNLMRNPFAMLPAFDPLSVAMNSKR